jgi:hypothetical protein
LPKRNVHRTTGDRCVSSQPPMTSTLMLDKDVVVDRKWIPDYSEWIQEYLRLIRTVCAWHGLEVIMVRMSPSAHKGQHFRVDITPPISARLANRLHYLLGDDCRRVDLNQARIESGLADWSKLFERVNFRPRTIYRSVKVPRGTKSGKNRR